MNHHFIEFLLGEVLSQRMIALGQWQMIFNIMEGKVVIQNDRNIPGRFRGIFIRAVLKIELPYIFIKIVFIGIRIFPLELLDYSHIVFDLGFGYALVNNQVVLEIFG